MCHVECLERKCKYSGNVNQCYVISQPESPNVTCTAESRAQIPNSLTIPTHELEPPKVVCTTGWSVNKYA